MKSCRLPKITVAAYRLLNRFGIVEEEEEEEERKKARKKERKKIPKLIAFELFLSVMGNMLYK
jgi:hypothetical protein